MKSEYDRTYQWHHDDNDDIVYLQKRNRDAQLSEPRMTHKRRVKLTEDNVVIGEPLLHQSIGDLKENISIKKATKKNLEKEEIDKIIRNENRRRKKQLVNEAVQTEKPVIEQSTQLSKKVPSFKGQIDGFEKNRGNKLNNKPLQEENHVNGNNEEKSENNYKKKYAWQDQPRSARASQMMSNWDTKLKIYSNFISEYQRQFRPYEFVTENRYKKMKPTNESNLKFVPDRRALTPPPQVNVKNKCYKSNDTVNPQRLSFPHGKQKRFLTEYSANYDNKWDRLDAEMTRNVEEKAREASSQAKWFQEILELRKKAQEYRQRSRGTHFSREHLGQVYVRGGQREDSDDEYNERERMDFRKRANKSPDGVKDRRAKSAGRRMPPSVSSSSGRCSSRSSSTAVVVDARKSSPGQHRTAGKPTRDDSVLLDEEASHDTALRSPESSLRRTQSPVSRDRPSVQRCPVKRERQYTLNKYFSENSDSHVDPRRLRTLDYDSVSKCSSNGRLSTRSIVSSSTMSLAKDTLERAKRNRDELMRQKS